MTFYKIKANTIAYSRIIFFIFAVLLILITSFSPTRVILDQAGNSYLSQRDEYWAQIAYNASEANWQTYQSLGNISRHHRYAPLKSELWWKMLEQEQLSQGAIKGIERWAKKNRRNIDMQVRLAELYIQNKEPAKCLKTLSELATRISNHVELQTTINHCASSKSQSRKPHSEALSSYLVD